MIPESLKHHSRDRPPVGKARDAKGLLLRAVVIEVYRPDDMTSRQDRDESEVKGIYCDVMVIDPLYRGRLSQVPVLAQSAGVNDYEQWKPRKATADITGETLSMDGGSVSSATTDITDTDGDYVLVGFMGGDLSKPVIMGQLPHKRTKRRPSANDATLYKWRRHIRGVLVGVTESGGVEIDLSESSDGSIDISGVESVNGDASLVIRAKDGGTITVSDSGNVVFETATGGNVEFNLAAGSSVTVNGGGLVQKTLLSEAFLALLEPALVECAAAYAAILGYAPVAIPALQAAITSGALESDKLKHD
jgi:hypothetical protein